MSTRTSWPETASRAWTAARRTLGALGVTLAVHLVPAIARACAACGPLENERERKAFFDQTLFMTLMPLAAIAVGLFWLARRGRAILGDEFRESADAVVPATAPAGARRAVDAAR